MNRAFLRDANLWSANLSGSVIQYADLSGADLRQTNFRQTKMDRANMNRANLMWADFSNAGLFGAKFVGADLTFANLHKAMLRYADMRKAKLERANMSEAHIEWANFSQADLTYANLSGSNLTVANFSEANLRETDIENAWFRNVELTNAIYEPASVPRTGYLLSGLSGLSTVRFGPGNQSALVSLREALRAAGLRTLEREATFAIEHGKTRHALNGWRPGIEIDQDANPTTKDVGAIIEGVLKLVFFEWTTGYGLYYGRPFLMLFGFVGIMTLIYIPALAMPRRSGIFRIWPKGRIEETGGTFRAANDEKVERLTAKGLRMISYAFYFSVLSAFRVGWRDLNIGGWLTQLQGREYALRASGWVRIASGFQSLVSVYLLAMWVLTYFGRPFQ